MDWHNWCGLCGNFETVVKVEDYSDLYVVIKQLLQVRIVKKPKIKFS